MEDTTKKGNDTNRMVVVDLGKKSRKAIKKLRRGEGKLTHTVDAQLDALRAQGAITANANVVVVVVERKPELTGRRMRIF